MRRVAGIAIVGLMLGFATQAQQRPQELALQAAIRTETVVGDLKKAIGQYEELVRKYGKTDRAVAAQALLRMADCYQKLGDAQARTVFERVVREYADQKQAVDVATSRLGSDRPPASTGMISRQLWTGAGVDTEGTVSSDGRYLSYTDWDTGDLALRDLSAGTSRRLTNKGTWTESPDFAEESALSRDGSQVAYSWFNAKSDRYELRLMRVDAAGAPVRTLFDNPDVLWVAPFDWSPDGSSLAVELTRRDRTTQLGLLKIVDGSFRALKSTEWRGSTCLSFSPDGSLLVYDLADADGEGRRDVYVMRADGSREVRVAQHPATDMAVGWSSDGSFLLFASDRGGAMGLWSIAMIDGRPAGKPSLIKSEIGWFIRTLGLSRSGTLVYGVRTGAANVTIAPVDFATGKVLASPAQPFVSYLSRFSQASWSPDGKLLVAVEDLSRTRAGLTIATAEGQPVRRLPVPMTYIQRPVWAPDNSITIQGVDPKGRQGFYRVDSDTGETTPLVLAEANEPLGQPSWTPDGKVLVFRRNGPQVRIVARQVVSGEERVVFERSSLSGLSLSPDGARVAFVAGAREKRPTLLVMPVSGGTPAEIANLPGMPQNLTQWTADGQSILFTTADGGQQSLWVVAATPGSSPRRVELDDFGTNLTVRVHPDGRRIAYSSGKNAFEVWALENFLPAAAMSSRRAIR